MWSALKQKKGNISIGRHTSRFKIVPALVAYLGGHSRESILVSGIALGSMLVGEDPLSIRWGFSFMCVCVGA